MSRKRILNITSEKHKDNMCNYTNTVPDPVRGGTSYSSSAAILVGGETYIFPFIATARPGSDPNGQPAYPIEEAARQSDTCYMRGLKERVQVQTSTGIPWQWRRICFTMKGDRLYRSDSAGYRWSLMTSAGVVRVVNNFAGTVPGSAIVDLIFDGANGVDWISPFTAKTDNDVITVKYDRTRIIQSGNSNGVMRNYTMWHGMNHNIMYDDEEYGDTGTAKAYSVNGKQGMGDYYIIDIISAGTGATTTDRLSFQPEATLYWHEK